MSSVLRCPDITTSAMCRISSRSLYSFASISIFIRFTFRAQPNRLLPELLLELLHHDCRHEARNIASVARGFSHDRGCDEGVFLVRHEKDRLDLVIESPVHERHLHLVLEIGNSPESADDRDGVFFPDIIA